MDKLQAWTTGTVMLQRPAPETGGWLAVEQAAAPAMSVRERVGRHAANTLFGAGSTSPHSEQYARSDRLLSDEQLWLVYQRTPDVRAAIDAIVRRVATWDWLVEPTLAPSDPGWQAAKDDADQATAFLKAPNSDGETWQELWTKTGTDLLVFDAGVIENVFSGMVQADGTVEPTGDLDELVALRGSTVAPVVDTFGHLLGYRQNATGLSGFWQVDDSDAASISPAFEPGQITYLRLFPNTASPLGCPLIETLVNEIITVLRAAEHSMLAFDADEIPPGILVLTGIAGKAAQSAKADLQQLRGKDHKVRVITNPDPKATGAHWVELRHNAKDTDMVNVVDRVRRTIWRVFGVMPIEMGASEDIPRAVGQVQLEVAGSHLINPILELVEAKVNARILPLVVSDPSKVRFRFDRESKLSADDQKAMAATLVSLVREGLLTRNEARAIRGDTPVVGGDVVTLTTGQGVFPLASVVGLDGGNGTPSAAPDAPPAGPADTPPPAPGDAQAAAAPAAPAAAAPAAMQHDHGHDHAPSLRALVYDPDLPSAWQRPGVFSGQRVLDLVGLHDVVSDYARIVNPLYAKAATEATAAVRAAYRPGKLSQEAADQLVQKINATLDKLDSEWTIATDPLYRQAARIGLNSARDWTGQPVLQDWRSDATQYGARAMQYLAQPSGLLSDLRARAQATINSLVALRAKSPGTAPANLDAEVSVAVASEAMEGAFVAQHHRVKSWSGRLVELANATLAQGLLEGSSSVVDGKLTAAEWMVEWVHVGDGAMCATCEDQGSRGFVPLSSLPTVPGGDTECRGNCRCVLVMWTKQEVETGNAIEIGPQDG
jgi:hypothetical protein